MGQARADEKFSLQPLSRAGQGISCLENQAKAKSLLDEPTSANRKETGPNSNLTEYLLGFGRVMNQLPPLPRDQRKIDADHLKLLSIFHFVGAGLALFGLLFLFAHYAMFHAFFANPKMWESLKQSPPPAELFAAFKWFYLIFAIWFVGSGILNVVSGLFIRATKHRTFSMIVSGINCLHMPLGTVLGVFTIIILIRDSVRELYEA